MQYRSAIASPSTTDPIGTVGVDMASNPLTLGYRKLRSAVNLAFEEGVIRTRPGFYYQHTGTDGQFQGAFHYSPSRGLSARAFAPKQTGLVFVTAGKLFVGETTNGAVSCVSRPICGPHDFTCKGPVDIYQAENWLIVQNSLSNTHFWSGSGCLLESPGMGAEPIDTDAPLGKAPPPTRGRCWSTGTYVLFTVLNGNTNQPIEGATVSLKVGSRTDYTGQADVYGEALFYPVPKTYSVVATRSGFTTVTQTLVVVDNDTKFITIRLFPVTAAVFTVKVRNSVGGTPIQGATVVLKQGVTTVKTQQTVVNGNTVFDIVAGTYRIEVSHPNFPGAVVPAHAVPVGTSELTISMTANEYPAVLVLVLDQTGSIGVEGAQRGVDIIDQTDVQAIGYVSFSDTIIQIRPITTNLTAVRAELDYAANNEGEPPFYGDSGGDVPENGVDALSTGLDLIAAFNGLPGGARALFFKTDTIGYKYQTNSPGTVNTRLNQLDAVWLEFGELADGTESGFYETTFPETPIVSHSTFPLPI